MGLAAGFEDRYENLAGALDRDEEVLYLDIDQEDHDLLVVTDRRLIVSSRRPQGELKCLPFERIAAVLTVDRPYGDKMVVFCTDTRNPFESERIGLCTNRPEHLLRAAREAAAAAGCPTGTWATR